MMTAATRAKMQMLIAVTNQKTKSIRLAWSLAARGSQGTSTATSAAPAPHTAPIATSWRIDPLRTGAETTGRGEAAPREANSLETPATREVQTGAKRVHAPCKHKED